MKNQPILSVFLCTIALLLFIPPHSNAVESIAVISQFEGDVVIVSEGILTPVTMIGTPLLSGNYVQTRDGSVEITFNDGAIMQVNPYTSTAIKEREEVTRTGLDKVVQFARRITCFVGKLWFKSGSSNRKNYLQTPTAVAGVRGSQMSVGYDGQESKLDIEQGSVDVIGDFLQGFFEAPGVDAAQKSEVFTAIQQASAAFDAAETPKQKAEARVLGLEAIKQAAQILKENNPSPVVNQLDGNLASLAADASIAAAEAAVEVEAIKENVANIDRKIAAAREAGNTELVDQLQEARDNIESQLTIAENAAAEAATQAENAWVAADQGNSEAVQNAVTNATTQRTNAQDASTNAQSVINVVDTPPDVTTPDAQETEDELEDEEDDYTR